MFRLILIVLLLQNNLALVVRLDGKTYRADKFITECECDRKVANLTIIRIDNSGSRIYFDFELSILNNIQEPVTLEVLVERCPSQEVLDYCKVFRVLRSDKFCLIATAKHQNWTPMMKCIHPQIQCPPREEKYSGTNCTLNVDSVKWFPIGRYYWKIKTNIYSSTGEKIYCSEIEGQRIRNTG